MEVQVYCVVQGYSGGLLYDAQYMTNTTGVIVVTVNYRLGAMGFLVYGQGEDAITGNFGLRVSWGGGGGGGGGRGNFVL